MKKYLWMSNAIPTEEQFNELNKSNVADKDLSELFNWKTLAMQDEEFERIVERIKSARSFLPEHLIKLAIDFEAYCRNNGFQVVNFDIDPTFLVILARYTQTELLYSYCQIQKIIDDNGDDKTIKTEFKHKRFIEL